MKTRINVSNGDPDEVLECLRNSWVDFKVPALTDMVRPIIFPISPGLINQETIWNETIAKRDQPHSWGESIERFHKYYSVSKHRFMARGGEVYTSNYVTRYAKIRLYLIITFTGQIL